MGHFRQAPELAQRVVRRFIADRLDKSWLMAVRRGWLMLMKPHIQDYDDVIQALKKLDQFVENLKDQVTFVRKGPLTGLRGPDQDRLLKKLDRLEKEITRARQTAKYWQEWYDGTAVGYHWGENRKSEAEHMLSLYKRDFDAATSGSVPRKGGGGLHREAPLTEFFDRVMKLLYEDAKRIRQHYQQSDEPLLVEEPAFKEFDPHGMKVVVDDDSLGSVDIQKYVKYLDKAYELLRSKGFQKAWYGTVFIRCKECGGVNKYGPSLGVGGHYRIGPDTVGIFSRPSGFIVELMAHELGHRYWYKSMHPDQRARFEQLVKIKGTKDKPGYGELGKKDVDDVAKLADELYKPLKPAIQKFRREYTSTKVDRFGNYEDAIFAQKELFNTIGHYTGFGIGNPIRKMVLERFVGPRVVRYAEPREHEARRKQLNAVLDHYLASSYELSQFKWFGKWDEFIKKTNEAEVWRNIDVLDQIVDKVGRDLGGLVRYLYKFAQESPHVEPVSDYGSVDISEAFAEAFEHYVLEQDMSRDQLESFRSVIKTAAGAHERSVALMKFLSAVARRLGVAKHVYVVGGAVRNWLIGKPIKDIDVVVDSVGLEGKGSDWFARRLERAIPVSTNLTTNQYGVAILTIKGNWDLDGFDMTGEIIEIANARTESYGGAEGKGYKPHMVEPATIEEDLARREFTFNTLLWRLEDLAHGPDKAEVLDMLGVGRQHLEQRELRTPVDPDKTFSDDPTRMLRAVKFVAKYGFRVPPDMVASIRKNAPKLKQMPWDAVRKILTDDILDGPAPRKSVELLHDLGLGDVLKEMLHEEKGFATALGRSLGDKEIHLLLDLLDQGWAVRTPVSFLDRQQQIRLREILLEFAGGDPGFDKRFVGELVKPSVDQQRLFTEYAIPPRERGEVIQIARRLLLENPLLNEHPRAFEAEVKAEVARHYSKVGMPERVAKRYAER